MFGGSFHRRITLAHVAQYSLRRKDHVLLELSRLSNLPIDSRFHSKRGTITECSSADQSGTNRSELIEGFGEEELPGRVFGQLIHATRQIITDSVAQDIVFGFLR